MEAAGKKWYERIRKNRKKSDKEIKMFIKCFSRKWLFLPYSPKLIAQDSANLLAIALNYSCQNTVTG